MSASDTEASLHSETTLEGSRCFEVDCSLYIVETHEMGIER